MSILSEPIGSIPRPAELIAGWVDKQAGRLSDTQFAEIADRALRDTIRRFEETGSPIITDGEQTKSSFATYPLDGASGRLPHSDRSDRFTGRNGGARATLPLRRFARGSPARHWPISG